ncbi:tRNA (adenosine(37)-N6)-threonylcarbamoyltransferase complex ATPase subunit type 1 TsaE [Pseudahrensia aquimaris]|uniref:tRNA threonylcarbamoyladenosine biosynthesis protein TsaE n=1 Tax=Pseudahrensia aquimaris TaxID=744461 RepID=A0ABW3FGZ4_9HYPH
MAKTDLTIELADERATAQFGEDLALALRLGDLVTLSGDLGAGKTSLARALIRAAADDAELEVPSPTFTLMQPYENLHFGALAHFDLYRLVDPRELDELGLDDALAKGVALVEWPDKGAIANSDATLAIRLEVRDDDSRLCTISGNAAALERLGRSLEIRHFLDANDRPAAQRRFLTGDASTRSYETIRHGDGPSIILMNAPPQPDGPPIRDGKPYSQIAHLAEDMTAFYGVQKILTDAGFRAPQIHVADLEAGILLIENLGVGAIVDENRNPISERYEASIDMLVAFHANAIAHEAGLPDGTKYSVPPYDGEALAIEVDLLPQWYAEHALGKPLSAAAYNRFTAIWAGLIERLESAEKHLVLRDFHSPNIIWRGDAKGSDRIGLIDFQDAVIGPSAYDVAALALDARVNVSEELESSLADRYCSERTRLGAFDEGAFRAAYAIMGAQRVTKILGIFVRLSKRDGKHSYLAHLPRMEDYLARTLRHPALAELKAWVDEELAGGRPS